MRTPCAAALREVFCRFRREGALCTGRRPAPTPALAPGTAAATLLHLTPLRNLRSICFHFGDKNLLQFISNVTATNPGKSMRRGNSGTSIASNVTLPSHRAKLRDNLGPVPLQHRCRPEFTERSPGKVQCAKPTQLPT